jgi:hypothetical protein
MTSADTSSTMTVSQTFGFNGQADNYLFTVKNNNDMTDGDYMLLYAPNEVSISPTALCVAKSGVRGFQSCKYVRANVMKLQFYFTGKRMLGTATGGSSFSFMIQNITNPISTAPSS